MKNGKNIHEIVERKSEVVDPNTMHNVNVTKLMNHQIKMEKQ